VTVGFFKERLKHKSSVRRLRSIWILGEVSSKREEARVVGEGFLLLKTGHTRKRALGSNLKPRQATLFLQEHTAMNPYSLALNRKQLRLGLAGE
jgi:hypothetical protein